MVKGGSSVSIHVDIFEEFKAVSVKIDLLACSSTERLKLDGMSNVGRFVSRMGNDLMPSVSANVTDVVNYSGWMDTQVFVCADDVNAAT